MRTAPLAPLPFPTVDRGAGRPLPAQIYDGYREAIAAGRLGAGRRLPSTRSLAAELGVSRASVLEAFERLVAEGYCESRVGAGTFVATALPPVRSAAGRSRAAPAEPPPGQRRLAAGAAGRLERAPPWLRGVGPFALGGVAVDEFPFRLWSRLVSRVWRDPRAEFVRYGEAAGYRPLREALADYLRGSRGVRCDADQIIVVSGSQQALELTARVLFDPGSPVWVEEPGYWGVRDVLRVARARLVPVPVDEGGLDVAAGIELAPQARAAYVTPSHQFPLGATMNAARRLQLLDWARCASAWVVEDDYDSEFRFGTAPIAALQGLDRDARVVYVGTLSKMVFPGLRLGYLVVPPDLVERFRIARWAMDVCPAAAWQHAAAELLRDGHLARHVRRTREIYAERRTALVDALRAEMGAELELTGEQAGLHLVVALQGRRHDRRVAERAAAEGLWVTPVSDLYLGRPAGRGGLLLGYGGTETGRIADAVRRLVELLRSTRRARPAR